MNYETKFTAPISCVISSVQQDRDFAWAELEEGMLLDPHSRFFLRHTIRFRTPRGHGEPLPFRDDGDYLDVESVLLNAIQKNQADLVLRKSDVIRLTKLEVRPAHNIAILLFRRSDPEAATPIFENPRTRALRKSDKRPDEAVAVSAHLFVHLGGIPDAAEPTYHAILEEVPGISRTYIQGLLAHLLRQVEYGYTDRRGEEKTTYTMVDFHGERSERIGGAIQGNTVIPSVTLIRPGSIKGLMDVGGMVVPREERMKLILKAAPDQALGVIRKIQDWMGHHDWSKLLVEMHMPEDRTRLVEFAREVDAADILFVRSVPVNVTAPLEVCTDQISEELTAKAIELFAADGVE